MLAIILDIEDYLDLRQKIDPVPLEPLLDLAGGGLALEESGSPGRRLTFHDHRFDLLLSEPNQDVRFLHNRPLRRLPLPFLRAENRPHEDPGEQPERDR